MANGGARKGAGRPKGSLSRVPKPLKELAQQYTAEAVKALVGVMRNGKTTAIAKVHAANSLLDRGHGKAKQELDVNGRLTLEQLVAASFAQPGHTTDDGD